MEKVQNAGALSGTAADDNSIQSLCIAAAQEQRTDSADDLASLKTQLDGVISFLSGINAYTGGVTDAASGAASVASGASGLSSGASSLLEGAEKLADGTNELSTKTGNTDLMGDMQEKIDEVIGNYSNGDYTPVSFVSEKNLAKVAASFWLILMSSARLSL
jgi:X-X-X-Leu-X-X-Gly heptad repeat protein